MKASTSLALRQDRYGNIGRQGMRSDEAGHSN